MKGHLVGSLPVLLFQLACAEAPESPRPDVLLITIDTLRADYVHAYGFDEETTPNIDGLARRGVLFENAIAAATLTAPAHASIMTSRYVREHSIGSRNGDTRLEGPPTLAELFRAAGYSTAAFVSNVVLRKRTGLDRGFGVYDDDLPTAEGNREFYFERVAEATATRALAWLAAQPGDRPVFLWLHLQDPHGPYAPPADWPERIERVPLKMKGDLVVLRKNAGRAGIPFYQAREGLRDPARYAALYAEEIRYADHWAGQVVSAVESRGGPGGPVILLTADHGESLGEMGWFFQHGQSTAPELARVPFIVVAPGLSPRRIGAPVSHVDVAPTLLDLAGVPGLQDPSGLSLRGPMRGEEETGERLVFCDTDGESAVYGPGSWTRVQGPGVSDRASETSQPNHSESAERTAEGRWRPSDPDSVALKHLAVYLARRVPVAAAGPMAPEHIEQLRALGYLAPTQGEGKEAPLLPSGAGEASP